MSTLWRCWRYNELDSDPLRRYTADAEHDTLNRRGTVTLAVRLLRGLCRFPMDLWLAPGVDAVAQIEIHLEMSEYRNNSYDTELGTRWWMDERQEELSATLCTGINELRRRDVAACMAGDVEALLSLWAEDGVLLAPGQPPARGKEAIRSLLLNGGGDANVVEYEEVFAETRVVGDYAFEWGKISGAEQHPGGELTHSCFNVLRVLRQEADGSWQIWCSAFNEAPTEG